MKPCYLQLTELHVQQRLILINENSRPAERPVSPEQEEKKWWRETRENRMFWFQGRGLDRNYFLNHSNLNSLVLSAGKFWALGCPDSLASHQCIATLRGLFRPASSDVVIKKPPLINSWTFTGFRGTEGANVGKMHLSRRRCARIKRGLIRTLYVTGMD